MRITGHAPLHAAGNHVFPFGSLFAPNHPSWGAAAFTSDTEAHFRLLYLHKTEASH